MTGRPREFDETQALERAMNVFWCRGYDTAGMRELLEAMRISRQSCYNAFGDKRSLFLKSLRYYGNTVIENVCRQLGRSGSPLGNIRRLLVAQSQQACKRGQRGCLVLNSVVEFGSGDAEVTALLRTLLERMESAFRCALEKAQDCGELSGQADPQALASYLIHISLGFSALGKIKMSKERTNAIVNLALLTVGAA